MREVGHFVDGRHMADEGLAQVALACHAFGGWKASGFGDLNQQWPDVIRFRTRTKTATFRRMSGIRDAPISRYRS